MHKYLPSKKFILLLLSIIIFLGIIYSYFYFIRPKTLKIDQVKEETKTKIQEFVELDTDNDGLKDWEEILWGTNPNVADTDGDGTNDYEEIMLNRDPLKPNINPPDKEPSDKTGEEIIIKNKKIIEDYNNLTVTEKVSREFFIQFINYENSGYPLTESEKSIIVEKALSHLPTITFKTYTEKDIPTIISNDNESLRIYSNKVAEIILIGLKTETEDLGPIMDDFSKITDETKINEQTEEIFKRLTPLIEKNQKIVSELLKINPPQIVLVEHLKLENSFQATYENLDLIQKSAKDLILLIPLLNRYEISTKNLSDSLAEMTKKLLSLKITYNSKKDFGYAFFNVIMFKL